MKLTVAELIVELHKHPLTNQVKTIAPLPHEGIDRIETPPLNNGITYIVIKATP